MKILISACLLGQNVKYDGHNNSILENPFIQKLLNLDMLISICPEIEGGLPTPRVPVEIIDHKAINQIGEDKTIFFQNGAQKALNLCKKYDIKYAILKFRSPSCGSNQIYDGTFSHTLIDGDGICAKLLKENGIKIFTENSIKELESILFNERLKDFMKIEAIQEMINEKTIYVDYDDDYRGLGDIGLVNRIDFHPTIVFLDSNGKVLYKPITKIDGADDLKRLLKQIK